jgi:hypothetical protein
MQRLTRRMGKYMIALLGDSAKGMSLWAVLWAIRRRTTKTLN